MEDEVKCPSCGRFVGAYEKCPYCQTSIKKRLSLRILKIGAVVMTIVGIIVLYFASKNTDIPEVKISDITQTMNFAYIKVTGTVLKYPSYDGRAKKLSFLLSDGKNELRVSAFKNEVITLERLGKIPDLGDIVTVAGNMRVREANTSLMISMAERMEIKKPEVAEQQLSSINDSLIDTVVKVRGVITEVKSFPAYTILTINNPDSKGSAITVPMRSNIFEDTARIQIGKTDLIEVTGLVDYYRDNYQVSPVNASALKVLEKHASIASEMESTDGSSPASASTVTIETINEGMLEKFVSFNGTIERIKKLTGITIISVSDSTGRIDVVVRSRMQERMENYDSIKAKMNVTVNGKVAEYKGNMQVEIVSPTGILPQEE